MSVIDNRPARLDYKVWRGDDFADTVTINEGDTPADLTGRTYAAQVRRSANGPIVASMTIDDSALASGVVGYAIDHDVTETMGGTYFWDFQQDDGGGIRTLMHGKFVVDADITRP